MTTERRKKIDDIRKEIINDTELNRYLANVESFYPDWRKPKSISFEGKDTLDNAIKSFENANEDKSVVQRKNRWRLIIDGAVQKAEDCNPLAFEDEPGYHAAMYRAFELMERTINQPLTVDLIIALHDMAVDGVKKRQGPMFSKDVASEHTAGKFALSIANVSDAGFKEMILMQKDRAAFFEVKTEYGIPLEGDDIDEITSDTYKFSENYGDIRLVRYGKLKNQSEVIDELQKLINKYYQNIASSNGNSELIIKAIADFAHQADLLHPFDDGNVRTIVFLVVNKLLLENGFPPAIFEDPNRFDGYTVNELYNEINDGMNKAKEHGFTSLRKTELSSKEQPPSHLLGLFSTKEKAREINIQLLATTYFHLLRKELVEFIENVNKKNIADEIKRAEAVLQALEENIKMTSESKSFTEDVAVFAIRAVVKSIEDHRIPRAKGEKFSRFDQCCDNAIRKLPAVDKSVLSQQKKFLDQIRKEVLENQASPRTRLD